MILAVGDTTSNFVNPGDAFSEKPLGGAAELSKPNQIPGYPAGQPLYWLYKNAPVVKADPGSNDTNDVYPYSVTLTDKGSGNVYGWNPQFGLFPVTNGAGGALTGTQLQKMQAGFTKPVAASETKVTPQIPDMNAISPGWGKKPSFSWAKKK